MLWKVRQLNALRKPETLRSSKAVESTVTDTNQRLDSLQFPGDRVDMTYGVAPLPSGGFRSERQSGDARMLGGGGVGGGGGFRPFHRAVHFLETANWMLQ